jgi:hypothetical protein
MSNHIPDVTRALNRFEKNAKSYQKLIKKHRDDIDVSTFISVKQRYAQDVPYTITNLPMPKFTTRSAHEVLRITKIIQNVKEEGIKLSLSLKTLVKAVFHLQTVRFYNQTVYLSFQILKDDPLIIPHISMPINNGKDDYENSGNNQEIFETALSHMRTRIRMLTHLTPLLGQGPTWNIYKKSYINPEEPKKVNTLTAPNANTAITLHIALNHPTLLFNGKTPTENGFLIFQKIEDTSFLDLDDFHHVP